MGYKDSRAAIALTGIQTEKVIPTLVMGANDDILDQNLGTPVRNIAGAQ